MTILVWIFIIILFSIGFVLKKYIVDYNFLFSWKIEAQNFYLKDIVNSFKIGSPIQSIPWYVIFLFFIVFLILGITIYIISFNLHRSKSSFYPFFFRIFSLAGLLLIFIDLAIYKGFVKIFNYKKFHFAIEDFYLIIALFCLLKSIININTKKITIKDIVLIALIISFLICWRFITKTFKRTIPHNIPILGAGGSFSFDSYLEWMILFMALMFGRRGVFIAMLIYTLIFVWIYPSWFLGGVANNPNSTLWYAFLIYVFKYIIPYLVCALVKKSERLYSSIGFFLFICLIYTTSNSIAGYIFNGKLDLIVSKWELKNILLLTLIQQSIRNSLFMVVGVIIIIWSHRHTFLQKIRYQYQDY